MEGVSSYANGSLSIPPGAQYLEKMYATTAPLMNSVADLDPDAAELGGQVIERIALAEGGVTEGQRLGYLSIVAQIADGTVDDAVLRWDPASISDFQDKAWARFNALDALLDLTFGISTLDE